MRLPLALLAALTLLLAGCLQGNPDFAPDPLPPVPELLKPVEQPLWYNPQNFPHPAFGYPTLTNPANGTNVPKFWAPIPAADLPKPIAGMDHFAGTGNAVPSGAGMALFGSLAIVPGYTGPTHILDISDPKSPKVLSKFDDKTRGTDTIAYPDGRLVSVFADRNGVLTFYELTDPTNPVRLSEVEPPTGIHKVNVVPGTPIVYNANSKGGGQGSQVTGGTGQTEIYDATDPEKPVLVQEFKNGYGCHHIYFHINPAQNFYRAYCAGIQVTQIWDISDPKQPHVIVTIPVHHGVSGTPSTSLSALRFSHFSIASKDAKILIVGDETGGGGLPACDVHVETPIQSASGPLGNLYFYDISDEKNPVLKGWLNPGTHLLTNPDSTSCTAHHGRLVPDPEGRNLLAMAFYGAGVVLVDFTDPSNPHIVDQWNDQTTTWEVWYYNGYLFTGDLARGLDVLKFK